MASTFILLITASIYYFANRSLGVTSETRVSCSTCTNCVRSTDNKCICKEGFHGRYCKQLSQTQQFAKLEIPSNMQSYRDIPLLPGQCRSLCSADPQCIAFSHTTDNCRLYSSWEPSQNTTPPNMHNTFIKRNAPSNKIIVYSDPIARLSKDSTAIIPRNETTQISFRPTVIEGGDALLSDRPFDHSHNKALAEIAPSKHLFILRQGVINDPPLLWTNRSLYISPI